LSVERVSLTAQGQVRYRLKTPYRDGTTDIVLEPLDFMARLAAREERRRRRGRHPERGLRRRRHGSNLADGVRSRVFS
jgi:hypothetical protein